MNKREYESMYRLETNFWWYKVLHKLVEESVSNLNGKKDQIIVDAGCGTGRMLEILQKYGNVSGIDYSPDAIEFAKKRGLEKIILGDLNEYDFENESIDILISLDVLYHAAINDDKEVLSKFYSSLKVGGILILNLPAFEYLKRSHDIAVHTKRRYKKSDLNIKLEKIGFKVIKSGYRLPHLYFIILISKLLDKLKSKNSNESDLKEIPHWINNFLTKIGYLENKLIKTGLFMPVGSSVFVIAKKLIKE